MKSIAYIHTDFPEKFGIPRQSGLVDALKGQVVFEPEYRSPEAVRGLEQFSHIWLLWQFSESKKDHWSATVKPPRLGGKKRVGVFASRSPYRPNGIGLSCVRLERIEITEKFGPVLYVAGVDLILSLTFPCRTVTRRLWKATRKRQDSTGCRWIFQRSCSPFFRRRSKGRFWAYWQKTQDRRMYRMKTGSME